MIPLFTKQEHQLIQQEQQRTTANSTSSFTQCMTSKRLKIQLLDENNISPK